MLAPGKRRTQELDLRTPALATMITTTAPKSITSNVTTRTESMTLIELTICTIPRFALKSDYFLTTGIVEAK